MAKPMYVRFEVPKELADRTYEVVEGAREGGKISRGANEVTKLVERAQAKLVIMSEDVDPPEVLAHVPYLCEEKSIPYTYVPSKQELGKAAGLGVATSAVALVDVGGAKQAVDELVSRLAELKKR